MADDRKQTYNLVSPRNREFAKRAIDQVPEGWECIIQPPRRSKKQNGRLHALLSAIIKNDTKWAGRTWDIDSWRRLFLSAYLLEVQDEPGTYVPGIAGEFFVFQRTSTTELSVAEFSELMAFIESKMAEWGVPWFDDDEPIPAGYMGHNNPPKD